jgi:Flp pilus assembly protein TadD
MCCGIALLFGCSSRPGQGDSWSFKNPLSGIGAWIKGQDSSGQNDLAAKRPGKADPEYYDKIAQARVQEKAGKYDRARDIYEKLIRSNPDNYEAYHRLAVVADRQKRLCEAEELFSQAVGLEQDDPEVFNDYGYCLFLQGKLDHAELALLKAVSLSPRNPRFLNNLGMVCGHQGRHEEAMEHFRLAGSEADAFYNMAFVLAAQENIDGAKSCFHLALRADPTYESAQQALESFEEFEADPDGRFDLMPLANDGLPWVPYVEGSESGTAENQDVQQASHISLPGAAAPFTSKSLAPTTYLPQNAAGMGPGDGSFAASPAFHQQPFVGGGGSRGQLPSQ